MKVIPFFPLNLVAFPGEEVNLHIFEPRYKQLVNDCLENSGVFGIPSYVTNKIELGTEVMITEVTKAYADGRMDVKTKSLNAFIVKDYWNPWGEKLYAGGKILKIDQEDAEADSLLLFKLKELCGQLFAWLDAVDSPDVSCINSVYEIGHKIGLKLEEEYKLLSMTHENDRLRFAIQHLENLLPALERVHFAQERIRQNGHFKHLDPLEF